MADLSNTLYKLQLALKQKGIIVLINTSQFYSEEQDRIIKMYIIKQNKKEIIKTSSIVKAIKALNNIWQEVTEREKKAKKNLTQRQIRFVQDFMKSNNVTQAAIRSGYSKKTASVQGSRLLTNVKVAEYVDAINERLESDKIADIQEVMEYLTSVMRGEAKDQFDLDASLSERTRAASELAKRLDVRAKTLNIEGIVNIIDDIPEDVEIIDEDD